ncbi:MAG: RNA polymerase sigma factor SigJ [Hyphomicrobiales bacterium]
MRDRTEIFEDVRPRLTGIAYRMLGSVSDAQDAVQDTYLNWATYDGPAIDTPAAWLSRVCTNICLDRLKAAHKTRLDYVGPWIPDQIQTDFDGGPEERAEIASSLTTAFLLLLERLTPKERASYLLHDIFGMPFEDVAAVLDLKPANCRKLAARARAFVAEGKARHIPDQAMQIRLLDAFQSALRTGNADGLAKMLRDDADLRADSGGKVIAIRHVIEGSARVSRFISEVLSPVWKDMTFTVGTVNGLLGILVEDAGGAHAFVSFSYDPMGRACHVFVMRHPDKLNLLTETRIRPSRDGALLLH